MTQPSSQNVAYHATENDLEDEKIAPITGRIHGFDMGLAQMYGVEEAILIHHFQYWVSFNKKLNKNFRDGRTWTYQSRKEIQAHFPYWTLEQIRHTCEKLEEKGVLMTANYNKSAIDKTLWYAFVNEKAFKINMNISKNDYERENSQSSGKIPNPCGKIPKPIPDNRTDNRKNIVAAPKSRPTAKTITLDFEKREFIGITQEDLKIWKEKYSNADIDQCLKEASEWAMSNYRKNYRTSINAWISNNHKGPKVKNKPKVSDEVIKRNKKKAELVEKFNPSQGNVTIGAYAKEFLYSGDRFKEAVPYDISESQFDIRIGQVIRKGNLRLNFNK